LSGVINRGAYHGFYKYKQAQIDAPENLPAIDQFELQHGIHYRAQKFSPQLLPLRNMPTDVRKFLEELNLEKNKTETINRLIPTNLEIKFSTLLNAYEINANQELELNPSLTTIDARIFITEIIKFLKTCDYLYKESLAVLKDRSLDKRLKVMEASKMPTMQVYLQEQIQQTRDLLYKLGQQQATARLYKFVSPTLEEIEKISYENKTFNERLETLKLSKLSLESSELEQNFKTQLMQKLDEQEQQLKLAQQITNSSLLYISGRHKHELADKELDRLIKSLEQPDNFPDLDKDVLLNRAYNLKAKIAARRSGNASKELAVEHYRKAIEFLPDDVITRNNLGGLLTDRGVDEKNAKLHLEAYRCYKEVSIRINQIKPEQQAIAYSGIAYGLILLAQCIEQKQIAQDNLPSIEDLRKEARRLLTMSIATNANYLNARLHLAILCNDEGKYEAALQEIDIALTLQFIHPTALMYKGFILNNLGNAEQALKFLEQAKGRFTEIQQLDDENASRIEEIEDKIAQIKGSKIKNKFL